jgi:Arc/MetJ family transcription regulator
MRTTLALDDELLQQAQSYLSELDRTALLKEALRALVARESAKRLALLGGSEPNLDVAPRRREKTA